MPAGNVLDAVVTGLCLVENVPRDSYQNTLPDFKREMNI